jgi:hypothetical protein
VGRFVIGEGVLSWHPRERISDRYGTVFLMTGGDSLHEPGGYVPVPDDAPVGLPGRLVAEVQATRQSTQVACHEHGTVRGGFLPGSWDHPVASDGTTRRSTPEGLIAYRLLQVVGLGGSRWRSGRLT